MEPINILLSRDELMAILDVLAVPIIPGVDADPLGELTPAQQTLALTVARRALRARELARLNEANAFVVHNMLLNAVGTCAYAEQSLFVYHWQPGSEVPTRYFGHIRGDAATIHARPEAELHLFTILPSKDRLLTQILDMCGYQDVSEAIIDEFIITQDTFTQARSLAEQADITQAIALLTQQDIPAESAQALADALGNTPRVSVMQTLQQRDQTVRRKDFTLLQNGHQPWFIIPAPQEREVLVVRRSNRSEIQTLLAEWL